MPRDSQRNWLRGEASPDENSLKQHKAAEASQIHEKPVEGEKALTISGA